jgi:hypothetical protein
MHKPECNIKENFHMLAINTTSNQLVPTSVRSNAIYSNRSRYQKIGNILGKGVLFFKRQETKTATLIGLWSLETLSTLIVILNFSSFFIPAAILLLHIYTSYCLFSTINSVSTKTNG